ncbi:MAG: hypothetical protein MHPSP_003267, partial [Paramarteilia canceri]
LEAKLKSKQEQNMEIEKKLDLMTEKIQEINKQQNEIEKLKIAHSEQVAQNRQQLFKLLAEYKQQKKIGANKNDFEQKLRNRYRHIALEHLQSSVVNAVKRNTDLKAKFRTFQHYNQECGRISESLIEKNLILEREKAFRTKLQLRLNAEEKKYNKI